MKFLRDLFLALLCGVATLLILEGGLRLARDRFDPTFMKPDAARGYALRPNFEAIQARGDDILVKINSDGMRDKERSIPRRADTFRVAVIGASNAENVEVPMEETFEAVMERELSAAFAGRGKRAEVLNFGVEGYAISQVYLTLQRQVWKYDPKAVVMIFDQSMVRDNTRKTFPPDADASHYPFCDLSHGKIEFSRPTSIPAGYEDTGSLLGIIVDEIPDIANRSYLLSMVHWAIKALRAQTAPLQELIHRRPSASATPTAGANNSEFLAVSPDVPELREDWEISDRLILAMKEECDRRGADLWIVMSTGPPAAHPDRSVREAFMRKLGVSTLDATDERMERFGAKNGIHVLPLTRPLRKYAEEHDTVVNGKDKDHGGHMNRLGNELTGRLLATELEEHSSVLRRWLGQD